MKKNYILIILSIIIFGGIGTYLTFFSSKTDKYDRQTEAYKIDVNEEYDSEDNTIYRPIYYFKVDGKEYKCEAKSGSSFYPKESKNKVYYDSTNPTKCKTEYEQSTGKTAGIICLVVAAVILILSLIKWPSNTTKSYNSTDGNNIENQLQINQENVEKAIETFEKIQLIVKRVILGIVIFILLILIIIDSIILKQTLISKDYAKTTAEYVTTKEDSESDVFKDCVYSFTDKDGKTQEITVSFPNDDEPDKEILIKYNENDPQDYYLEGAWMEKSGIIWYIVKIVAIILLTILFFNKKILTNVNLSLKKE